MPHQHGAVSESPAKKRKKVKNSSATSEPVVEESLKVKHKPAKSAKTEKKNKKRRRVETEDSDRDFHISKKQKKEKNEKKHKKKRQGQGDEKHTSKKPETNAVAETKQNRRPKTPIPASDECEDDLPPIQPSDMPSSGPRYPIWTRRISEYVAIAPAGFRDPFEYAKSNYLDARLNNFVPKLQGVLVSYKNVIVSDDQTGNYEAPGPPQLQVIGDYGPAYCWLVYDAGLFVPAKGAWMEGVVILEDSEHIGIQCWKLFNAFISARRLPQSWQWSLEPLNQEEYKVDNSGVADKDDWLLAGEKMQEGEFWGWNEPRQEGEMHDASKMTWHNGEHWVDERGRPVRGRIIRFRIRNFDAQPAAFNQSHLSIEGTLLRAEDEEKGSREDEELGHYKSRESQLAKWGETTLGARQAPVPPRGILKNSQR